MNITILYIFLLALTPIFCVAQDAATAYNAGVTSYRSGQFVQAQKDFEQALELVGDNAELAKRSRYNLAASTLQHAQELLPEAWETKEVDGSTLEQAIQSTTATIETLKKFLESYPDDKKAAAALKHAQDLLKKLEEKKKQQEKKQDQDKKDQDKQDKDQDQKDQDKKDQDQDKQNQEKQDQKDKQQQNKDKQKQEQGQDKDKQKPGDDSNEEGKEGSEDKEQKDQKKNEGDQDQTERDRENKPDESEDRDAKGDDQESDQNKDKDAQKSDTNPEHAHHPQPSDADGNQADQEMQETENENIESMETRGLRAMLENLQADESKAQKRLLRYQTGQNKAPSTSGQKPW